MDEPGRVLLVGPTPDEALLRALSGAGYTADALRLDAALAGALSTVAEPGVVLLDAVHHPVEAAALSTALEDALGAAPPLLVTTTGDPAAVEPHLAAGLDALLPPYLPALVRARVDGARTLARLTAHSVDLLAEADRVRKDKELQIGHDIQQGFLPETLPQPAGWDVAARFRPAREVAGDFYDAFEMVQGRRVGFVIADVCDKGVGAALFMALIRTLVRHGAQQNVSMSWVDSAAADRGGDWLPAARGRRVVPGTGTGPLMNAVAGTNRYMTENHLLQGYFATMFFAMLDPHDGSVVYVNGGHNPPYVVRADGSREQLPPTGPAVGMMPGVEFRTGTCRLEPGDTLFTYTDGVPEAKDDGGAFFGVPRLEQVLDLPVTGSADLLERVDGAVRTHVGTAPQFDDITMLAVRRCPL